MLTRIRIEVTDEESAGATEAALDRYEDGVKNIEAARFGLDVSTSDSLDRQLGREVTDEVIEYDASLPGYKGRRVVRFVRLDTRIAEPSAGTPDLEPPEGNACETSATVSVKTGANSAVFHA